jgi:hypothetical protein
VLIIGSGIAGLTCSKILSDYGWTVSICSKGSSSIPILVVNENICNLLEEIWGVNLDLLSDICFLSHRHIVWNTDRPLLVPHSSRVIQGNVLTKDLFRKLKIPDSSRIKMLDSSYLESMFDSSKSSTITKHFRWIIDATGRKIQLPFFSRPLPKTIGRRCIISIIVTDELENIDCHASIMEATLDGWIFLTPIGNLQALIQIMVPTKPNNPLLVTMKIIKQSKLISRYRLKICSDPIVFDAFPQISLPLCDSGWIAVGESAVAFDPISGSGMGNALRSALLACGVINGIESGLPSRDCLDHYAHRLKEAFHIHINDCIKYYTESLFSKTWKREIKYMNKEVTNTSQYESDYKYRLQGFNLVPACDTKLSMAVDNLSQKF